MGIGIWNRNRLKFEAGNRIRYRNRQEFEAGIGIWYRYRPKFWYRYISILDTYQQGARLENLTLAFRVPKVEVFNTQIDHLYSLSIIIQTFINYKTPNNIRF